MNPKIYLIGRSHFETEHFLSFLQNESAVWHRTPGATKLEEIVEVAGRVCYMSFGEKQSPRSNGEYVRNLIEQGHESVLEHVTWTFVLTGVSRAFTHQLVRHRVGFAFSQLSQQYHEETEAMFVEPTHLQRSPKALEAWRSSVAESRKAYAAILDSLKELNGSPGLDLQQKEFKRAIRSAARSVLPNATETKIVMTANARALRHFFKVRGAIPGDLEMRQVAAALIELVRADAPALFEDFAIQHLSDGSPVVVQTN